MTIEPGWKAELRSAEVLRDLKTLNLPIDPFEIATRKDIVCQENSSMESGISGCMVKAGDNFGILYSTRFPSEGFQRFTVAHELGHYFMDGHVSHLFADGQTLHQSQSGFLSKDMYELEADAFAAGLLMPKAAFQRAMEDAGEGISAIEALATLCRTSLTATAIRLAKLSTHPLAVLCSTGDKVDFAIMSDPMRLNYHLTWPKRGAGIPPKSTTALLNSDEANVRMGKRMSGEASLAEWFHAERDQELNEEAIGLGEYGRTLTVLWSDSLPDNDEIRNMEEDPNGGDQDLLPSQRFYRPSRY
jgi:Zn-dependent peptidase ImmA (M78 family)